MGISQQTPYADDSGEGRIRRSWRLTREAWDVVRRDRTALVLAILSALSATAIAVAIFVLSGALSHPHQRARLGVAALIAYWPSTFVASFIGVALAAAVAAVMRGEHLTLRQAFGVSWRRVGQIALWSLLAAGVGVLLQEIASRLPWGGRLASWLLGTAWGLVTLFAIPVLALEGCTAGGCVRRSGELLRRRWGEGVAGTVTITAWTMALMLPLGFALGIAAGAANASYGVVVGVEVGLIVLLSSAAGTARSVFAVALYRYAADGEVDAFRERDLQQPFSPKKRRRLFRRS